MVNNITFRMVAWTDAAGKYDPNAPLNGNEDNYYADDNLGDEIPNHIVADEDIVLSDCGMLMAVADGMGGMNAGEVASQIAHDTVAERFAPGIITPQLAASHECRSRYMEDVIREADRRIKMDARHNRDHEGMGSTLIMAWLAGDELTVTWIGDSRAYRFNPATGIEPLSKDHSYVQELADKGIITYEQTFEHPQGNIITRSLGDESRQAQPESRIFKVHDGDIILLCSDGLSGVLRDRKTYDDAGNLYPGDNLEDIIREHSSSLIACRESLWSAAEQADWYDNVTAILCEIRSGAGAYLLNENQDIDSDPSMSEIKRKNNLNKTFDGIIIKISHKKFICFLVLFVLVVAVAIGGVFWHGKMTGTFPFHSDTIPDTVKSAKQTDTTTQVKKMRKDTVVAKRKEPKESKLILIMPTDNGNKTGVGDNTVGDDTLTRVKNDTANADKLTPVKNQND